MTLNAAAGRTFSARNIKPFLPLLVYAALVLVVVAIYFSFFRQFETLIQEGKMRDLGAIADMKADQIAAWRDSQKRTAEAISRDSLLVDEFSLWSFEGASAKGHGKRLRKMLAELQYVNGYRTLILLDRKGTMRLSLTEGAALGMEETLLAKRAMDGREVLFSDIHRNSYGNKAISIDVIAPLIEGGEDGRVIGAAVLQIDPHDYLYPMINAWPVESASAESLLVRQDGDGVLFLNDVRHLDETALTLRMPLDSPKLPSAVVLHGGASIVDGIDYRGVPVVAEMRQVPGAPWFVVSKVDRDELFAPVNRLRRWSTNLGLTVVLIGGLLVFVWLQGHRARVRSLRTQHMAELERKMLMKHFQYLTRYANDIIMLADESGRIVEVNERAERAYGYSRDELLRMRIPDLRDPAEDPAVFQRQLTQLREFGELRFETVNVRKDGTRFPIESSARIIDVEGVKYLQGIIRDISERKQAEDALRRSETLLKKSQQMARIGSWELDLRSNLLYWSDENYRIFEIDSTRFDANYEAFLDTVHPEDRDWVNRTYTDSVQSRKPYSIIHRLQFPDGRIKFVQEWCETHYDESGQPLRSIGTTQDVTEQQLAQNALRQSAQQIEDLYNHAPCGYHSLDQNGVIVQINDTELQWLGYEREEVIGKMNFTELIAPAYLQVFRDNYPRFKEEGEVRDLEYELVRKDGTSFFALLSATAVYDADGAYLMSRSTLFDITERKLAEDELRLHGAILYQMEEGVVLVRADSGAIVYVNPKFEQMFGYAHGEMVGLHVSRLNAPTARSPEEEAREIMAALQAEGMWSGEIQNRKKDDTPFWCHAVVSTFEHHDYGKLWVSTHEDITARKQAEIRLEESEERFRFLAENASDMLYRMSLPDGRYEYVSPAALTMFGYTPEEFYASPALIRAIIHPAWHGYFEEQWAKLIAGDMPPTYEYQVIHKHGETRWMNQRNTLIRDESGKPLALQGIVTDVTERRQAEIRMEESEERFRIMADSAPIIIWIADEQGQTDCHGCQGCNYFNQRWYEFTGLPRVRGGSCEWESVIHAEDERHFLDAYREAFRDQQAFAVEYRLRRHDGVFRWVRDSGVPRYSAEGAFLGFIGTTLDVTDLKLFDGLRAELERAGRLQIAGEMASGLAHELSQPVSATNNYLSACLRHMEERDWDRDRMLKMVSLAHAQIERAGEIINHLKDMVRQQQRERIRLDINALVRDTVHFMEFEIRQKSVAVIMDFYELPPPLVSKIEIEQVLINLIKNAIDSMESAPQRVLRIATRIDEAGFILVSVSDTGKGIAQDELDKVFNPFQTSKEDGLGLGLAICRSLVERHGGQIWAERPRYGGTRLNFTLPVGENDA